MAKLKWLDNSYQALQHFVSVFVNYFTLPGNLSRFGFEETTKLGKWFKEKIAPAISAYLNAYSAWENEKLRNAETIDTIMAARKDLEPRLNRLVRLLQMFPDELISDKDLDLMGVPPRQTGKRSPSPVASRMPGYLIELPGAFRVVLHFFDKERGSGKPKGQHGAEIASLVTTATEGVAHADLTRSTFDTNSPCTFDFPDTDRGKRFYFSLRWENTRGEKGPWTPVDFTVIP
ncbi:MAG: hypothetical protein LBD64_04440 [Odoribacteraceae bacterium]|jgi:hypothetical protein|nr:hypothetical protein [Odoribacteraceae bacterium]